MRYDHDKAVFGELSYDLIPEVLTATVGVRYFRTSNNLYGFYRFQRGLLVGFELRRGAVASHPSNSMVRPAPTSTSSVKESDSLSKVNLTWNIDDTKMIYATLLGGLSPGRHQPCAARCRRTRPTS